MTWPTTAAAAHDALRRRKTTSSRLVSEALERALEPSGQGSKVFLRLYAESARAAAAAFDERFLNDQSVGPLTGLTVSIKDLFDVQGEVTLAGSKVLHDAAPASRDAPVVQRLKDAGAILVGRTNMTEFAYSGLGLNPHYGTPLNPFDRPHGRIPGGSSSGAAVAITDDMALVSVATDTGGSARIPAAFCGLTGFKPTASRIPTVGVHRLSPTLDSVGAIGRTVDCCYRLDAVLSGAALPIQLPKAATEIVLGVVEDYLVDDLQPAVSSSFARALARLSRAGVRLKSVRFPELFELPGINAKGGFAAYESYQLLGGLLKTRHAEFDPRVAARISRGTGWSRDDYDHLQREANRLIEVTQQRFAGVDALVSPTVPMVAPLLSEVETDEAFSRVNLLALRNPSVVNFIDGCAWSLPCQEPGDLPVGFSLFQSANQDHLLLSVALAVESILKSEAAR